MRMPPLPSPPPMLTPEQMAQRVVGDRAPEVTRPIVISPYDSGWPGRYAVQERLIRMTLGPAALAVEHVGSTAVPGLPAKDRIDIDLIVANPADEDAYVPALASAGYTLRTREPHWYEHRCLWTDSHDVSLHVFGPDCDEHLRHLIFRDWLRADPEDRDLYAACKLKSAAENPMSMSKYVGGKGPVIVEILMRAGLR